MPKDSWQSSERDAELTHAKATKAEFARDYDQAFHLYLKSAEAFLHLSRSGASTDKKKQQWKATAGKALERAETIKKFADASRSAATSTAISEPSLHLTPVAVDIFSPQEQLYILNKGGHVNNRFFSLWDEPVSFKHQLDVYIDPDGQPKLSPEQETASPLWQRPPSLDISSPDKSRMQHRILAQEILQHIVTDCSVCASVSVCLEHGRRFGSSLAESAIHNLSDSPEFRRGTSCPRGRYDVRILFNGGWRRVLIDDQLPYSAEGKLMCMTVLLTAKDRNTRCVIWPSLLEKAYMKLMGGYDFLGSNSSIDLHALIGWIPEHIDMRRSQFEREKTWERIKLGFLNGQCLVTLGTGVSPDIQWRDVHLLSSHSYAVIDVHESIDDRVLVVLDSWVHFDKDQQEVSSMLRIPWTEVLNTFDGLYLSWDPHMWPQQLTFHGMWKQIEEDEYRTSHLQAEFRNTGSKEDEILVLLARHVDNTKRTSDYVSLHVDIEHQMVLEPDLSYNRQLLSPGGAYTNSSQILSRIGVPLSQQCGILSISASYEGDGRDVGYTLTVYAPKSMKLSWVEKRITPLYTDKVSGSFTSKTAGGNSTYPSFMVNPQYRLVLRPMGQKLGKAKVTFRLRGGKDLPVNVILVWSQGQRISEYSEKDLAATSGAYSYGLAQITTEISPGEYTIVVSAFEPQHTGPFTLKIESSHAFDIRPIPQEGAGMYCKVVRGCWEGQSAAGAPTFNKYTKNPILRLEVPSTTQLKIRLQLLEPSSAVALNVTVYSDLKGNVASSLTQKGHVLTSGAYDDSVAGVATPQISIVAGRYYIVPSSHRPGFEAGFRLIIYSSLSSVTVTQVDH